MNIFDYVLSGLGNIIGYELLLGVFFVFAFLMIGFSRALGFAAVAGVFILSVYLFATEKVANTFLLPNVVLYTVILLAGLFAGFIVYQIFWRE